MAEYIEREALLKELCFVCNDEYSDEPCEPSDCFIVRIIKDLSAADVVSRGALEQIMWERDLAIQQLREDYGVSFGEKKSADVVEVVRCKDCKHHRERNEYEQNYLVEGVLICTSPDATDDCWNAVLPNHFCSYGERRADDG